MIIPDNLCQRDRKWVEVCTAYIAGGTGRDAQETEKESALLWYIDKQYDQTTAEQVYDYIHFWTDGKKKNRR